MLNTYYTDICGGGRGHNNRATRMLIIAFGDGRSTSLHVLFFIIL